MGVYAYVRVSTKKQDVESQKKAIEEWAAKHNLRIDRFFEDDATSGVVPPKKRPGFSKLWETLQPGDTLIVFELSRLGRSLKDIVFLAEELRERGVTLISIKEGIDPKQNPLHYKITIALMGIFAELERELIKERTKAGMAKAKAEGKHIGRPRKLDPAKVLTLLKKGLKPSEIAGILGVSKFTVYSCLRRLREAGIVEKREEWVVKA